MCNFARTVELTGSDQAVLAAPGIFRGYVVRETAGSAATIRLYDNASAASGPMLGAVNLAANGAATEYADGIWCANGIYVDVGGTGTIAGTVLIG